MTPKATSTAARVMLRAGTIPTPAGRLAVLATVDGVVRASGYQDLGELQARLSASGVAGEVEPGPLPDAVVRAVEAHAAGDVAALDDVAVEQAGGPFLQEVWRVMRTIPGGTTATYTELAEMAGRPAAVRAAGSACARNLVAPFVPCHRVVRSDGSLGGYAYGLQVKQTLLARERENAGEQVAVPLLP